MKSTAINKWISTGALIIIVSSVFFAYINLKGISSCQKSENFIYVQFLFMLIIGCSFAVWFINFRMLMFLTGLEAEVDHSIDEKILETEKVVVEEKRDLTAELNVLIKEIGKQNDIHALAEKTLSVCSHTLKFGSAVFFEKNKNEFVYLASWAYYNTSMPENFKSGIGLHGQVVKNCKAMIIEDLPENYFTILSGTGKGKPKTLYIIPIINNNEAIAVLEFASFREGNNNDLQLLENLAHHLSNEVSNINIQ